MTKQRRPRQGATLRRRLTAWWSGTGRPDAPQILDFRSSSGQLHPGDEVDFSGPPSLKSWSPARLSVVQDVFGAGRNVPASDKALADFLSPLDLRKGNLVADLGAGLGMISRPLRTAGCRVIAFESDKALASQWERTTGRMAGPPCEIQCTSLDRIDFGSYRFDYMVSKEGLLTVGNKPRLLEHMRKAMKLGGFIVLSDFVRTDQEAGMIYKNWRLREPMPLQLLTYRQWETALRDARFEIVKIKDLTAQTRRDTLGAFGRYARNIKSMVKGLEVGRLDWVLAEGEHWALRLGALEDGAVRVMRFVCRASEDIA